MKPAPIMPTGMGLPCFSLALSALSTMIMLCSPSSPQRHFLLQAIAPGLEQRRHPVLLRDHRERQGPLEPQRRIVPAQGALVGRAVELADLVAGLGLVLERLVAVGEALGHVEGSVV